MPWNVASNWLWLHSCWSEPPLSKGSALERPLMPHLVQVKDWTCLISLRCVSALISDNVLLSQLHLNHADFITITTLSSRKSNFQVHRNTDTLLYQTRNTLPCSGSSGSHRVWCCYSPEVFIIYPFNYSVVTQGEISHQLMMLYAVKPVEIWLPNLCQHQVISVWYLCNYAIMQHK